MKGHEMFMNELFRIVNGALRLDIDKVRNYEDYEHVWGENKPFTALVSVS